MRLSVTAPARCLKTAALPSSWSVGPMSASRRFSTASRGTRRAIVDGRWPARPATSIAHGRVAWAVHDFDLVDTGGHVRRERGSAARRWCSSTGSGPLAAPIACARRRWPRRARPGRSRRSPKALRETGKPVMLAINKTDDKRARGRRARVLSSWASSRVIEISAEHGRASAICSMRSCSDCSVSSRAAAAEASQATPRSRRHGDPPDPARSRSPSSAGRTPASRRWSIGCCARSA